MCASWPFVGWRGRFSGNRVRRQLGRGRASCWGEVQVSDNKPDDPREPPESVDSQEDTPVGAIVVTGVLALIILVLWFGIYALNLVRS